MSAKGGLDPKTLLAGIPQGLRDDLLDAYQLTLRNYRENRWEPAELNGGKLCEAVYSILRGHIDGNFPARASKPSNMVDACRDLEKAPTTFSRSVRIQIPRMLMALYEVRNNRGVGHVGGDVDPNHMDATCVLYMTKWVMGELVRIFHGVSTDEATAAVDLLVERVTPTVWQVGDKLRILDPTLSMKAKVLLLLYHSSTSLKDDDLFKWVEHSHASNFRRDVLRRAHKEKLLEYDEQSKLVEISPKGVKHVEYSLLK